MWFFQFVSSTVTFSSTFHIHQLPVMYGFVFVNDPSVSVIVVPFCLSVDWAISLSLALQREQRIHMQPRETWAFVVHWQSVYKYQLYVRENNSSVLLVFSDTWGTVAFYTPRRTALMKLLFGLFGIRLTIWLADYMSVHVWYSKQFQGNL